MNTTPRKPLVPSPTPPRETVTPGGIAGRAIATRENTQRAAPLPQATNGSPPAPRGEGPFFAPKIGHIAGAIAAVMSKVGTIEKRGKNEYFGYNYARMEDLLYAITPLMGSVGLAVIQNEVSKEILEGNRLAILYEFSIFHSSGEVWPERPRYTGVCISRDRKGNWDEKAVAKCHTNARKYFLLSLFQVPAGDFPDVDEDANQRQERAPVPGPKETTKEAVAGLVDEDRPHKIVLGQGSGADQWGSAYIRSIGKAKTREEVAEWEKHNDATLQSISDNYPGVYEMLTTAVLRRLDDLPGDAPVGGLPDPLTDPQEAMNWIAAQLQGFTSYEAGEAFWNQMVAPRENDFSQPDWEMLMVEWQRFETRFPQSDDGQDARS